MSFFVSKSIEDKIDENSLLKNENKKIDKNFYLEIEDSLCLLNEIIFKHHDDLRFSYLNAIFSCNIYTIDKIIKNKSLEGNLFFQKHSYTIREFQINKILKKDNDNYIVDMFVKYEEKDD